METKRVTLKELKEMDQFTAVNKRGVTAEFKVNGDSAVATFEDGATRELKLDSIRRGWLLVVEEEQNKEGNEMQKIKIGFKVRDSKTGEVGEVTGIQGRIITVENNKGDFPADIDNLEVIEATEKDAQPNSHIEAKPVEAPKAVNPKKQNAPKDNEEFKKPEEVAPEITTAHDGIHLLNYETAMGRKHEKSITDIAIDNILMRIKQNGAYIMDVNLYDVNGQHIYKAKNMSIKDALEFMGYEGKRMKEVRRVITNLRKAAKQKETTQA